jgi:hypothetical protein
MIGGYNPWFVEELNRRIEVECADKSLQLGQGMAGDFADYRYEVGVIAGLHLAAEIVDQIKREQDAA